ncbi:MAG TPA: YggT family protein [Syntrophomonadaceae bacterium]|nr:YggT family protein [Syntrophomonadaceae bacterium]HRX21332.1 YggT family protein [Syntrophomonadaceae bacterium]
MSTYTAVQIINIVNIAFQVLIWLVIIRVLLSWVRHDPYQPIIKFVYDITEPVMRPFYKLVPVVGGIDFSPIIVIFVLTIVQRLVTQILYMLLTGF